MIIFPGRKAVGSQGAVTFKNREIKNCDPADFALKIGFNFEKNEMSRLFQPVVFYFYYIKFNTIYYIYSLCYIIHLTLIKQMAVQYQRHFVTFHWGSAAKEFHLLHWIYTKAMAHEPEQMMEQLGENHPSSFFFLFSFSCKFRSAARQ